MASYTNRQDKAKEALDSLSQLTARRKNKAPEEPAKIIASNPLHEEAKEALLGQVALAKRLNKPGYLRTLAGFLDSFQFGSCEWMSTHVSHLTPAKQRSWDHKPTGRSQDVRLQSDPTLERRQEEVVSEAVVEPAENELVLEEDDGMEVDLDLEEAKKLIAPSPKKAGPSDVVSSLSRVGLGLQEAATGCSPQKTAISALSEHAFRPPQKSGGLALPAEVKPSPGKVKAGALSEEHKYSLAGFLPKDARTPPRDALGRGVGVSEAAVTSSSSEGASVYSLPSILSMDLGGSSRKTYAEAASRCPPQGVSGMSLTQSTSQKGSLQHRLQAFAEEIVCPPVGEVASRHTPRGDRCIVGQQLVARLPGAVLVWYTGLGPTVCQTSIDLC